MEGELHVPSAGLFAWTAGRTFCGAAGYGRCLGGYRVESAVNPPAASAPQAPRKRPRRAAGYASRTACQNPRVAPYTWTVREGALDGSVVMREYVYDVPDKEPVEGQELYLSNGTGPWRVILREDVPGVPRSPYNILVVERVF